MKYARYAPPNHLKDLVKCFWMLESTQNEILPKEYFLMADACPELVFQFNGGFPEYRKLNAYLRSQHTLHNKLPAGEKLGLFGVRLFPHAIQQLLNIPTKEMMNRRPDPFKGNANEWTAVFEALATSVILFMVAASPPEE